MTMTLSETALFQNKFALHLAVGLLGPTIVLEYLRNESVDRSSSSSLLSRPQQQPPQQQPQRVPLYWRSKIILPDTSIILQNNCGEGEKYSTSTKITASRSKLLFFDVTIKFVGKEHQQQQGETNNRNDDDDDDDGSCQILVSLGFFLLLRKGTADDDDDDDEIVGHYVSTKALNYQQLMSHITSLRLEPQSVKAEALANLMFESFLSQAPPIAAEKDDNNSCLNARYVVLSSNSTSIITEKKEENGEEENAPLLCDIDGSSDDNVCDLCVDIPCKRMGNSKGTFRLKISTVSKFDKSSLRFLYWDLTKNANHYHHQKQEQEQDDNELLAQVEDAFRELEKKMRPSKVTNNTTNITNNNNTISDNRNGESIDTTTTSNKGKIKQNPRFMPSKRRKKQASSFYAPSVEES